MNSTKPSHRYLLIYLHILISNLQNRVHIQIERFFIGRYFILHGQFLNLSLQLLHSLLLAFVLVLHLDHFAECFAIIEFGFGLLEPRGCLEIMEEVTFRVSALYKPKQIFRVFFMFVDAF